MYPTGYYKTNPKAISVRELIRWFGILRLPMTFFITRFRPIGSHGAWMPRLSADMECSKQDLSDRFWQMTAKHSEAMERRGFIARGFTKGNDRLNLNLAILDSGSIYYLHENKSHIGTIIYAKSCLPTPISKDREQVVTAFTAAFHNGSFSCTNHKRGFEPNLDQQVIRIYKDDVNLLHDEFLKALKRKQDQPIVFSDLKQMHQWFDANKIRSFENRVKRGLYVKMTDAEVNAARTKIEERSKRN
jgi:hypothetical protein